MTQIMILSCPIRSTVDREVGIDDMSEVWTITASRVISLCPKCPTVDTYSIAMDPLLLGWRRILFSNWPTQQRKELFDVGWTNKVLPIFILLPGRIVTCYAAN